MKDLTGKMFNGIYTVAFSHRDNQKRSFWIFRCYCGKNFISQGYKVTSGHTKSCGCMNSTKEFGYNEKIKNKIINNVTLTNNECWEWNKSLRLGYAQIIAFGQSWFGHRLSYKIFKGDFPNDLFVCHRCDNKKCINPEHLFLGTPKDNVIDMMNKGRQNHAKGTNAGRAKLCDSKVLEARRLYKYENIGYSKLARRYGVTSRTIYSAVNGKTWKHLKESE